MNNPRVIEVIEVPERRGTRMDADPFRIVLVYYTLDGEKLAEAPDAYSKEIS